jgi:hypothetical protein
MSYRAIKLMMARRIKIFVWSNKLPSANGAKTRTWLPIVDKMDEIWVVSRGRRGTRGTKMTHTLLACLTPIFGSRPTQIRKSRQDEYHPNLACPLTATRVQNLGRVCTGLNSLTMSV